MKRLSAARHASERSDVRLTVPIVWGPARGLRIQLRVYPELSLGFSFGRYEPKVAEKLRQHCQPGFTVWECGAYNGYFTIMIAKLVGPTGKVVVFEPDPINREWTTKNLQINHFSNVEILPYAIGENNKKVVFQSGSGATSKIQGCVVGGSATKEDADSGDLTVDCVSLDAMYKQNNHGKPQILKIDIEGAELFALPHAERVIAECRPIVFIESHNPKTDRLIWDTFTKHNYSLEHVPTGNLVTEAKQVGSQMLALPKKT